MESKIFNPQAKVIIHLKDVYNYFKSGNSDPVTIEVDPSNACNHSCPFCISGHLHLKKFKGTKLFNRTMFKKEILMKLVKDLSTTNIKSLNWTGGGEPTMNPHLKDAILYLKNNSKIKLGMFTNGSMLERFNLINLICESHTWIRISLDAGTAQSYDKLRITNKSNNFEVVLKNIKKLVEVKKKTRSKISIGIGYVVTKDNYKEIKEFANIFKDIDVDYCQFKPEIIQIERAKDRKNEQISEDFWLNEAITRLDEAKLILKEKFQCNSYKLEDLISSPGSYGRNYKECLGSQFQPCVGADGNVYVCTNHRGHKEYAYGSLYEKSFIEIWNDLKKRSAVMNKINNVEKFCKCSHLCKPHESNKILWEIKQNLNDNDFKKNLEKKSKYLKKIIKHPEFI
jgi:radical SAM protein with 4Fe4S-binding SPASM domain